MTGCATPWLWLLCAWQTTKNILHLYSIHVWKEALLPGSNTLARDILQADVYLRSSSKIEVDGDATCVTGDGRLIVIGFNNGVLATYTWQGKVFDLAVIWSSS